MSYSKQYFKNPKLSSVGHRGVHCPAAVAEWRTAARANMYAGQNVRSAKATYTRTKSPALKYLQLLNPNASQLNISFLSNPRKHLTKSLSLEWLGNNCASGRKIHSGTGPK